MLEAGQAAPALEGPSTQGDFSLGALRGRPVVVYFYPRDATSACTVEARDFRERHADFRAAGVEVVGISRDTLASHQRWSAKETLPFPLVSDETGAITAAWGVWREKKLYGRASLGIVRSTFLVDREGRLARVWDGVRVKGHVDEVLEAARAL